MKRLISISKLLVSIILLYVLCRSAKLDFSLLNSLFDAPFLLFIAFVMHILIICLAAWRWQQLNSAQSIDLQYTNCILPTYIGIALNNLLPGGVAGDFYRYYYLSSKVNIKRSVSVTCVFFDRVIGLMGICILAGVIAIAYFSHLADQKYSLLWMVFCLLGGGGSLLTLYLGIIIAPVILHHSFLEQIPVWLSSRIKPLLYAIAYYKNNKMAIVKSLVASVLIQLLMVGICLLCARIMHFSLLSFSDYLLAIAVCQLVSLIPISPGGIGVAEMAFANILIILNPYMIAKYATIYLAFRIIGIVIYLPSLLLFLFDGELTLQRLYDNSQTV